ncbi:hypothetical protein RI367_005293 [Sorochytrium milnesiophthora]
MHNLRAPAMQQHLLLLAVILLLAVSRTPAASAAGNKDPNQVYVSTQSLYPPYIDSDMSNRWWDFGGATVVNTNRYVRLTPDLQGRAGWLWARLPFSSPSWTMEFEFKIHGRGVSLYGDGMAFWYTKEKGTKGPVMGNSDKWNGLALAIDTYDNARKGYAYPYVTALINDGTKAYNKDTDGRELSIGGCEADVRDRPWATKARLKYSKDAQLTVELNTKGWDDWVTCFVASNVTLPSFGYYGFTAETGGLSDNHDIISVATNIITPDTSKPSSGSSSQSARPNRGRVNFDSQMKIKPQGPSYLTIFFLILCIAGMAFFGIKYLSQQTKDYKRF